MAENMPRTAAWFVDKGFVVLVWIRLEEGRAEQRDAYLVGCATQEESEARVRRMYPNDPTAEIFVGQMSVGDIKSLRLMRGEVRPWL